MSKHLIKILFFSLFLSLQFSHAALDCNKLLSGNIDLAEVNLELRKAQAAKYTSNLGINAQDFEQFASLGLRKIPEFEFIKKLAEKMNLRVWLFGGTASSYVHYAKWDYLRLQGKMSLQAERFDYDYTNIFRSTQDLDIVLDAKPEVARTFQDELASKYPNFLGAKAKWEVRTLRHQMGTPGAPGFKEALLNDADFFNQNSDSNSLAMVEITDSKAEAAIRDLRHWDIKSLFFQDALNNQISYLRSPKHFTTSRAKIGENPEILSVLRLLVKAFQYDLKISDQDFNVLKEIVQKFNSKDIANANAKRRFDDTAKKLVQHAVNIEYGMNILEKLGLRTILIGLGNKDEVGSMSWWINKEPLRSKPIGAGTGKTAKELGIEIVAHETNNFLAYESITRAHSGEPNVLISRSSAAGEAAAYGDGFYTRLGKVGARGTGLTIRFTVNPSAREGTDFTVSNDYIVFKNRKALLVIQESLNFGVDDLVKIALDGKDVQIDSNDLALLEKLKRKLNAKKITDELDVLLTSKDPKDFEKLVSTLIAFESSSVSKLVSEEIRDAVAVEIYKKIEDKAAADSLRTRLEYAQTAVALSRALDKKGVLPRERLLDYLVELRDQVGSLNAKADVLEQILLLEGLNNFLTVASTYPEGELKVLKSRINTLWSKSSDPRKKDTLKTINSTWSEILEKNNLKKLELVVSSNLFDLNYRNVSGVSLFVLAEYYEAKSIMEYLLKNSNYDFNQKNELGYNIAEQLRLLGKTELASRVDDSRLAEKSSKKIKLKTRNNDDSPVKSFVKIRPGKFIMGEGDGKVLVELTKPFEIFSTQTTQPMWQEVTELIQVNIQDDKFKALNKNPSNFRGDLKPVEKVSWNEVKLWIEGLNKLSSLKENTTIHKKLAEVLPGHKAGSTYRLPTEAEWEYVSRNRGLAEGLYGHGNKDTNLKEYAVFNTSQTSTVGSRSPLLIDGQPIYDIHGNVWEWVEDTWQNKLIGGVNPVFNGAGSYRVFRGGSYGGGAQDLRSADRSGGGAGVRGGDVGFRLLRDL